MRTDSSTIKAMFHSQGHIHEKTDKGRSLSMPSQLDGPSEQHMGTSPQNRNGKVRKWNRQAAHRGCFGDARDHIGIVLKQRPGGFKDTSISVLVESCWPKSMFDHGPNQPKSGPGAPAMATLPRRDPPDGQHEH